VMDWDGDGRPDIVAFGEGPTLALTGSRVRAANAAVALGLVVYLNQGNGKWLRKEQATAASRLFGDSITVADFDGDHHLDLATGSGIMGRKDLVDLHKPDGTWEPVEVDTLRPGMYVNAVALGCCSASSRNDAEIDDSNTGIAYPSCSATPEMSLFRLAGKPSLPPASQRCR